MSETSRSGKRVPARPVRVLGWLVGIRAVPGGPTAEDHSIDVWQWTRPKYRLRALALLLINALLFAGLGCFAYWLRTGRYIASSWQVYTNELWRTFDPTLPDQPTLIDFLLYPIPADQVPLMMVIVGLVLASLTAIPILVAMLYRFPFSLIFTAIIGFVAMLPWLAITLTFCCFLARLRTLRFSFHYATALVAVLPCLAYYALATQDASLTMVHTPVEQAKLYFPWVLALVAACAVMGVVLLLARLVNYRPGAIAPLLAVMFAIPVILFEAKVGRDELYYRLLETTFGPGSSVYFVDNTDASVAVKQEAQERFEHTQNPGATLGAMLDQVILEWQLRLASEMEGHRYEAVVACEAFREDFPESRYIPNTLYIEGRAMDMRVDQEMFRRELKLLFYKDFPNGASRPVWQELHDAYPDSPLWTEATLRLAQLEARSGNVDLAVERLDELMAQDQADETAKAEVAVGWQGFFAKRPAAGTLGVDPSAIVLEARKLRHLLVNNRDPHQKDLALRRLLSFDPRHPMYRHNLERLRAELAEKYPLTPLRDNLDVRIAATPPSDSLRIDGLKKCVEELMRAPNSDALPRARYELGLAYKKDDRPEEARAAFEDVIRFHPDSPWALEASRKLAGMGATARSS